MYSAQRHMGFGQREKRAPPHQSGDISSYRQFPRLPASPRGEANLQTELNRICPNMFSQTPSLCGSEQRPENRPVACFHQQTGRQSLGYLAMRTRWSSRKKLSSQARNSGVRRFIRRMAKPPIGRGMGVPERTWRGDHQGGTPLILIRSGGMYAARTNGAAVCTLHPCRPGASKVRQARVPGGPAGGRQTPLRPPSGGSPDPLALRSFIRFSSFSR